MLKEILHFVRHAPGVARLSFSMSHAELFDLVMERAEQAGRPRCPEDRGRDLEKGFNSAGRSSEMARRGQRGRPQA